MKSKTIKTVCLLALFATMSSGCVKIDNGTTRATTGDQLIDLVKARQSGAISEAEYEQLKRKILAMI